MTPSSRPETSNTKTVNLPVDTQVAKDPQSLPAKDKSMSTKPVNTDRQSTIERPKELVYATDSTPQQRAECQKDRDTHRERHDDRGRPSDRHSKEDRDSHRDRSRHDTLDRPSSEHSSRA